MNIGEFLIQLGEDPDVLVRFKKDPHTVMAETGLSEEQQELVMSGDVRRIQAELEREFPDAKVFLLPAWNDVRRA